MEKLIETFYTAFKALDHETMCNCYHKDIHFEDAAFGVLEGQRACNMWKMLCESQKGKGFRLSFKDIKANDLDGSAYWEAQYNFSKTGRPVHNKIYAHFEFKEGKIIKHVDEFDVHKWASMALGTSGKLLGWSGWFKNKLQKQTNDTLSKYEASLDA